MAAESRFWPVLPALFCLSYAVLTFEVALTRIFSIMLSYHFVFAIVSGALLGLGIGAALLRRWSSLTADTAVSASSVLFALLIAASVLAIIALPRLGGNGVWPYLLLAILPFLAAGLSMSGIFQRYAAHGPLLYGADLLGAALGALTVVPMLDALGGVNAVFLSALAAALGALLLGSRSRVRVVAGVSFAVLAAAAVALIGLRVRIPVPITSDPDKDMYWTLSNPALGAKIVESRWSSFGRTDVVTSDALPNEMTLFVDGAAGSSMYASAAVRDPAEMAHLTQHYGEFFPLALLKDDDKRSALIIGPGGGRDVVVALLGGVQTITAVEVNPDVVQIVKDYERFNGGIYSGKNARVRAIVAEGRNFVRSTNALYDLIMLAIPVTKSSRSVEGYALTENYLFTVEAFQDYFSHLTPRGRMIIVTHNDAEIYRLISMAAAALGKEGVSEQQAMKRMYTVAGDMMPALVVQKQALTVEEAAAVHRRMHEWGFDRGAFYVPYQNEPAISPSVRIAVDAPLRMFDQLLIRVADGRLSLGTIAGAASLDIGPVTDDRPFFYKFERGLPSPFGVFVVLTAVALVWLTVLMLIPTPPGPAPATFVGALSVRPDLKRLLLLFAVLGVAFMLVEIALFQKLMLFIGQPQRALTLLLFSLLLGGGIGSLSSRLSWLRTPARVATVSFLVGVFVAAVSIWFTRAFGLGLSPRATSMLLLVPLGVAMGMPFPRAVELVDTYRLTRWVSVMWGVNGVASVLGSALAMIIGISLGFSWALLVGAALYVVAGLLFLGMPKPRAGERDEVALAHA